MANYAAEAACRHDGSNKDSIKIDRGDRTTLGAQQMRYRLMSVRAVAVSEIPIRLLRNPLISMNEVANYLKVPAFIDIARRPTLQTLTIAG